jgi:hypothetical protein
VHQRSNNRANRAVPAKPPAGSAKFVIFESLLITFHHVKASPAAHAF